MKKRKINAITLSILITSPVILSYNEGGGNFTVAKKMKYQEKDVNFTSTGTMTYELRKELFKNYGWTLGGIVLNTNASGKITNIHATIEDIEAIDKSGMECETFGAFIPGKGIVKESPLRIIQLRALGEAGYNHQIVTNRGLLDINDNREYYDANGEKVQIENIPTTQAYAFEEVGGGYYIFTVTIELNRLGVKEVKDEKYVPINEREFMSKEIREQMVKDILGALTTWCRTIKHSRVHLRPLIVAGGGFEKAIPYFGDDITYDRDFITLKNIKKTVEDFELQNEFILAVDDRVDCKGKDEFKFLGNSPIKAIKNLAKAVSVGEDNMWYIEDKESKDEE